MRLLPFLVLSLIFLAGGNGMPQNEDSEAFRYGWGDMDRPSTRAPPEINQPNLDAYLCEEYNISCGNSGGGDGNSSQPQPKPNQPTTQSPFSPSPSLPSPTLSDHQGKEGCQCVPYYLCNNYTSMNIDGTGLINIRPLPVGCKHYLEMCCEEGHIEPPTKRTPPIEKHKCGTRNFEGVGFRITGGNDNEAEYGEFPWMVAVVGPDYAYQCGGSLIHPQVVLTAAHCVKRKNNLIVRAGEWDTQTTNERYPTQDRNVRQVIVHEQFNSGSAHNDLALLILDQPVDMSMENVGLLCLPEADENMDNRDCVVSGWGKHLFGEEGLHQVILKRVEMPMVPRAQCLEALRKTRVRPRFELHESFVCAGGIPGRDTCKGDGGSPLACPSKYNPKVYVQAGIVAWGVDCGTETPGVYVNVPLFINWIYNKLQAQGISLDF